MGVHNLAEDGSAAAKSRGWKDYLCLLLVCRLLCLCLSIVDYLLDLFRKGGKDQAIWLEAQGTRRRC